MTTNEQIIYILINELCELNRFNFEDLNQKYTLTNKQKTNIKKILKIIEGE